MTIPKSVAVLLLVLILGLLAYVGVDVATVTESAEALAPLVEVLEEEAVEVDESPAPEVLAEEPEADVGE